MNSDENEALSSLRRQSRWSLVGWCAVGAASAGLLVAVGRPSGPQGPGGGMLVAGAIAGVFVAFAYAGGAVRRLYIAARMARSESVTTVSRVAMLGEPDRGVLIPTMYVVMRPPNRLERALGSQSRPMLREFVGIADPGEPVRWYRGNMWLEGTLEKRIATVSSLTVTEAPEHGLAWSLPGKVLAHTCWAADGLRAEPEHEYRPRPYLMHVAVAVAAWAVVAVALALVLSEDAVTLPIGLVTALSATYVIGLTISRLTRFLGGKPARDSGTGEA